MVTGSSRTSGFSGGCSSRPTIILLSLFIAYPFVKGVWISLTSATVGVPGDFVGLKNFVKIWNDSIFQHAAYNTFVYTGDRHRRRSSRWACGWPSS